jgi:hypothetical protein
MPTPEQRFEVPPEYAEVYERAYRRAYEEGQGQLSGTLTRAPARRASSRGKRIAVPEQRTSRRGNAHRAAERTGPKPGQHSASPRIAAQRSPRASAAPRVIPPAVPQPRPVRRAGHRAVPKGGSTLYPVIGLVALTLLLMVGSFILGRVTAGTVSEPGRLRVGTVPGAVASASEGPQSGATGAAPSVSASVVPTPSPTATTFVGPLAPLRIERARTGCTAPAGRDSKNTPVSYTVRNVLDQDPRSAWRCRGSAIGRRIVLTLPRRSEVVLVGLIPGYARTDRVTGTDLYAQNNRITEVAWTFDDGTRVVQTMSGSRKDRTMRRLRIPPELTRTVTLRILAVARGPQNTTMISTVRVGVAARGSD